MAVVADDSLPLELEADASLLVSEILLSTDLVDA